MNLPFLSRFIARHECHVRTLHHVALTVVQKQMGRQNGLPGFGGKRPQRRAIVFPPEPGGPFWVSTGDRTRLGHSGRFPWGGLRWPALRSPSGRLSLRTEETSHLDGIRPAAGLSLESRRASSDRPRVGRFVISEQLEVDTWGVTYRAEEVDTGRSVHLRFVGNAWRETPQRTQLAARLSLVMLLEHPASIPVRHVALEHEPPHFAYDPVPETRLRELLTQGCLAPRARLQIAVHLVSAISAAHRLGLYHGHLGLETIRIDSAQAIRIAFFREVPDEAGGPRLTDRALQMGRAHGAGQEPTETADVIALGQILPSLLDTPGPNGSAIPATADADARSQWERCLQRIASSDPTDRPTVHELYARLQRVANLNPVITAASEPSDQTAEFTSVANPAKNVVPAPARSLAPGDQLGRHRIVEKLGEGGMGAVYKAEDLSTGQVVAIKVLSAKVANQESAVRRFHKEARLLAAVNNPYVTKLVEVNEDAGTHYMVMEFVSGRDLKKVLTEHGPLDERQALAIMADVARGLVDAHQLGIVHRDIKPENILLSSVPDGEPSATSPPGPDDAEVSAARLLERPRVKLSDFGIARHVDQSESLNVTSTGTILGTPLYMAPEQCSGNGRVTPQTDVYAMGATLFCMLTARPPFQAEQAVQLIAMHCNEPPPSLAKLNPAIGEATCRIVEKALAKQPDGRFADAAHMLGDIDRLLRGEPSHIDLHPRLPAHDPRTLYRADFTWELASAPERLWPFVSNTERLNRAVGLPSVKYHTERDPDRGVRKFGSFRLAGMTIRWEEHPFEWIEGQRMGILREFSQGPFEWFLSIVEVEPRPGGGTRLKHSVRIAPRNWLGRAVAMLEVGIKGRRSLDRVYHRIDQTVRESAGSRPDRDPFEEPALLTKVGLQRLRQRQRDLATRGVEPELVERLANHISQAPAQEVARIRPLELAAIWRLEKERVVDACLRAAHVGLLVMHWDILCPTCRISSRVLDTLREIERHADCEACNAGFEVDFAKSVEMIFRVHPEIRDVDVATYCIGGPEHSPHVVAQVRVEPHEQFEIELTLSEGEYVVRSPQLQESISLHVRASGAPSHAEWVFSPDSPRRRRLELRSGQQVLAITNQHARLILVRLERTVFRADVITAAQASSIGAFRELFPGEVLRPGSLMSVEMVTLLMAAIDGVDALYDERGDAEAFARIQDQLLGAESVVRRHAGAIVKFLDDGIVASFSDPGPAVCAALDLTRAPSPSGDAAPAPLRWRLAMHRGPAMVTNRNDRLDYGGAVPRVAAGLLARARGGELLLAEPVAADPEAAAVLRARGLSGQVERFDLPCRTSQLVQRVWLGP